LKLHRENLYQLVADGKLPAGDEPPNRFAELSASVVNALLSRETPTPLARPQLPAESVEILLAAVRNNTPINVVPYDGGTAVHVGGQTLGGNL